MNAPEKISLDRQHFIGGSDAAAILGLSPYEDSTPLTTYLKKKGLLVLSDEPDPVRERILRRGKKLEPYVVDTLIEVYGVKVTKRSSEETPNRYVDPEYDFLAAEIDFEWEVTSEIAAEHGLDTALVGTIQNGEVKTHHHWVAAKKYGEAGTDEIPVEYFAQGLHGQGVTGRSLTMVAMMSGSEDPILYWVKRDEETLAGMRARLVSFWRDHVLAEVPPAPVNLPDVYKALGRGTETKIEATDEIAALVAELRRAGEQARLAAEAQEEAKFKIGAFMLGAEEIANPTKPGRHVLTFGGEDLLTVSLQHQDRIDQKLLRAKHPEIAEECTKKSTFFTFRPKRSKS